MAEGLVGLLDGEIDELALDIGVVARRLLGVGDDHIDDDVVGLRRLGSLPWLGVGTAAASSSPWTRGRGERMPAVAGRRMLASPCLTRGSSRRFGIVAAHALGHRRMLLRHAVLAHLDDGIDLAAHVPDRIDAALVLDRAGHLAARPPHQRGRRAGLFDSAAPDAHVGLDVDARAHDREDGVIAERDGDLRLGIRA